MSVNVQPGGHVVLLLPRRAVVEPACVDNNTVLAGYGATQAIPRLVSTVSIYSGDRLFDGTGGVIGAGVSLVTISLPGLLLVAGALPFWKSLSLRDGAARMVAGVNAAVVGLLAVGFYDRGWISAVKDLKDFATVLLGFVFLVGPRGGGMDCRAVVCLGDARPDSFLAKRFAFGGRRVTQRRLDKKTFTQNRFE